MAGFRDRARDFADDFLRIAGVWALVGGAVTTLVLGVAGSTAAYLQGIRGEWIYFGVGITSGAAVSLLFTTLVWVIRRFARSAALSAESPAIEKGYLDIEFEHEAALMTLNRLMAGMAGRTRSITAVTNGTTTAMRHLTNMPLSWRRRAFYWVSNIHARRLRRRTVGFDALAEEYSRTAEVLKSIQSAYVALALRIGQRRAELDRFRVLLATARASLAGSQQSRREWKRALEDPAGWSTTRVIAAHRSLIAVLDRLTGVDDLLDAHMGALLDQLGG